MREENKGVVALKEELRALKEHATGVEGSEDACE